MKKPKKVNRNHRPMEIFYELSRVPQGQIHQENRYTKYASKKMRKPQKRT